MRRILIVMLIVVLVACSSINSSSDAITMSKLEYDELLGEVAMLEEEFNKTFDMRVSAYTKAEANEELSILNGELFDLQKEYDRLKSDGKTCSLTNFDTTLEEYNGAINPDLVGVYMYENTMYIFYPNGRCLIGNYKDNVMVFETHNYETTTDEVMIDNTYNYLYDQDGIEGFKKLFNSTNE
ncbi:MAG: hypothetical protein IKM20_02550 [Erysipelotrichales bacterium]|nr:hypothetical protein [Erysipelotrichales bacterium]